MNIKIENRVLRAGPGRRNVELQTEPLGDPPDGGAALVRNHLTLIYPGDDVWRVRRAETEGAWLGLGRLAVGRIERAGASGLPEGELVYWNGPHADYGWLDPRRHVWAVVPAALPLLLPAGIGAEAQAGLDLAVEKLGAMPARAVVLGQGMLGHLAGQWLRARGVEVSVVENSPKRLEFSKYTGLTRRTVTQNLNWKKKIARWNPGGADLAVDACGYAAPAAEVLEFLRPGGAYCRLGTWREPPAPAALEWLEAAGGTMVGPPPGFGEDARRGGLLAEWIAAIAAGKIPTARLLTHHVDPAEGRMEVKRLDAGVKSSMGVAIYWAGEPPEEG